MLVEPCRKLEAPDVYVLEENFAKKNCKFGAVELTGKPFYIMFLKGMSHAHILFVNN